jgi:tetratricopeptide (TPR) repeat protein
MSDSDVLQVSDVDELIDRGLDAVESEDLEKAERILDEAGTIAGENHVRVLHLAGMLAWAQGDLEHATGFLQQAADLAPDRLEIYLDCAECLFLCDERSEAEANVRAGLQLQGLSDLQRSEASLLLAQLRIDDDDPDEALEVLDEVAEELRTHSAYLSTLGAALLGADRTDEAVEVLQRAAASEPDDPEYTYQLAVALDAAGRQEESVKHMLRVLELDTQDAGGLEEPSPADVDSLKTTMEDVLEDLPDPLLKLVASAPITVQARATAAQVKKGVNPRWAVFFEGTPKTDTTAAKLEKIVIAKDVVVDEVDDDEEVPLLLVSVMAERIAEFFDQDIVLAEA